MSLSDPVPAARGRAGVRRAGILEALRGSRGGLGIKALAGMTGLHENTVRFHLDRLVADGLVERGAGPADGPGRPPLSYVARREPDEARDNYALIARVLADALAASAADPVAVAREAGRAWGRAIATIQEDVSGAGGPSVWEGALDRVAVILEQEGFAPEVDAGHHQGAVVRVHHCPFLALAREDQTVPCAVHLGLMEGVLADVGVVDRLEPFVTPSLCLAHLSRTGGTPGDV